MSNVRTLQTKQLTDAKLLEEALRKLGYNPVVKQGQTVRGDQSYDNRTGFDIVLKREDTKLAGDIGFQKMTEGFEMTFDSYIIRDRSPESFMKQITGEYLEAKARAAMQGKNTQLLAARDIMVNGRMVTRLQYVQRSV